MQLNQVIKIDKGESKNESRVDMPNGTLKQL